MNETGYGHVRDNKGRQLKELLKGRFRRTKIGYIERDDDENIIFGKVFEFSRKTIDDLRDRGYENTKNMKVIDQDMGNDCFSFQLALIIMPEQNSQGSDSKNNPFETSSHFMKMKLPLTELTSESHRFESHSRFS